MRKRLSKLPSPAMAVAFVALLAALTGTAVALPGSNTVTQGDLVNNSVGKGETKTNAIGRSEIRTNAAGGSEVQESSLGTVPTASLANAANQARIAGSANVAGAAFNLVGLTKGPLVGVNDGDAVALLNAAGFSISLQCDENNVPSGSLEDVEIAIENVSAGDDSHIVSDDNTDTTFDETDVEEVIGTSNPGADSGDFAVYAANGGSITGVAAVSVEYGGEFSTDCRGSLLATQG